MAIRAERIDVAAQATVRAVPEARIRPNGLMRLVAISSKPIQKVGKFL